MKRNRTICTLLSAAVLCACLWLAGCGQQGKETQQTNSALDPRIAEYLSLDSEQAGTLANGIQNVDVTTNGSEFLKLRTRCGTTILRFYISLLITI